MGELERIDTAAKAEYSRSDVALRAYFNEDVTVTREALIAELQKVFMADPTIWATVTGSRDVTSQWVVALFGDNVQFHSVDVSAVAWDLIPGFDSTEVLALGFETKKRWQAEGLRELPAPSDLTKARTHG